MEGRERGSVNRYGHAARGRVNWTGHLFGVSTVQLTLPPPPRPLTMFLAVGHVIGPVTCVHCIVVEQREWTLLNGGGAVPTVPVSGA